MEPREIKAERSLKSVKLDMGHSRIIKMSSLQLKNDLNIIIIMICMYSMWL